MSSEFMSTGQAARLCSVTPDTVLKWIKKGKLRASRTAGGHYRIPRKEVLAVRADAPDRPVRYCWEYRAEDREPLEDCESCITYRARALRCYELMASLDDYPEAKPLCAEVCEDCEYRRLVVGQASNVLVLTPEPGPRSSLSSPGLTGFCNFEVVDTVYALSAAIEGFRADFVVLDTVLGLERVREIAADLEKDPRLRLVRIVLATEPGERPTECEKGIFARIEKPLTAERLEKGLEELRSEVW